MSTSSGRALEPLVCSPRLRTAVRGRRGRSGPAVREHAEPPQQKGVAAKDSVLERELVGLAPGRALDLGCGAGANALRLAASGWSVVGLDWAERAIELAREAAVACRLEADFRVADSRSWRSETAFDLVLSTYALPGGADRALTLETAAIALGPGGTLVVAEWDRSMIESWGFPEDDLPSPRDIVESLGGLVVEKAEVVRVEDVFLPEDASTRAGTHANVALVRARRPEAES